MVKVNEGKLYSQLNRKPELVNAKLLKCLIALSILVNCLGLCFPILGSNDANFYSVVAKHIVLSGDWINLTFANHDWLDKPHFPFWITAISYKIFGINPFAYIFPGFVFNLIGAIYTYKLAKHLYSYEVGLLAALLYLSSLHLLLSSIDVRAEAFLLGEIMPACYYWLLYQQANQLQFNYLLKGALFSALAMMTKGIFVLLTISSGLISLWIYTKEVKNFIRLKWLYALGLSFIFTLPELLALYWQFDLHPEKIIFGRTHVSGIKFFFWDSQFGRFFNTGPITSTQHSGISHYLFFIHTFLWAFLPWSPIFMVAGWQVIKTFRLTRDIPKNKQDKRNYIYLIGCFLPTFILFSLTKFQLDHYTNILIPFAAILCANWLYNKGTRFSHHPLFYVQTSLAFLLITLVFILSILIFNGKLLMLILELCIGVLALLGILSKNRYLNKAIVYPVLAISLVFVFVTLVNGKVYVNYDAGYQIANYLSTKAKQPIIDYQVDLVSLELHSQDAYLRVSNINTLLAKNVPYYLVIKASQWSKEVQSSFPTAVVLGQFAWIPQQKFIPTLFNLGKRERNVVELMVVHVLPIRSKPATFLK